MNPKAKKVLIITGIALDVLLTIMLFVFSIVLLMNLPDNQYDISDNAFIAWFQGDPIRILLIIVLPLCLLLVGNIWLTVWYLKNSGTPAKKKVTLNDLSEEEKAALRQKILEEMAGGNSAGNNDNK